MPSSTGSSACVISTNAVEIFVPMMANSLPEAESVHPQESFPFVAAGSKSVKSIQDTKS